MTSPPVPSDLGLFRVLRDDGTADPVADPRLTDSELVGLLRQMLLIRTLDERCLRLQRQGRIAFYGTSTGQEAATIGSAFCLEPEDWCFPALRESGAALIRGMPVSRYVAQLMGNSHDEEKGHQQPMHFSWRGANHAPCLAKEWSAIAQSNLLGRAAALPSSPVHATSTQHRP